MSVVTSAQSLFPEGHGGVFVVAGLDTRVVNAVSLGALIVGAMGTEWKIV